MKKIKLTTYEPDEFKFNVTVGTSPNIQIEDRGIFKALIAHIEDSFDVKEVSWYEDITFTLSAQKTGQELTDHVLYITNRIHEECKKFLESNGYDVEDKE